MSHAEKIRDNNSLRGLRTITARVKKLSWRKKLLALLITALTVIVLIFILKGVSQAKSDVLQYLKIQSKMLARLSEGYSALRMVGYRDVPGYGVATGREQAKAIAEDLMEFENRHYEPISENIFRIFLHSSVLNCVSDSHRDNHDRLKQLIKFADQRLIDTSRSGELQRTLGSLSQIDTLACLINFRKRYSSPLAGSDQEPKPIEVSMSSTDNSKPSPDVSSKAHEASGTGIAQTREQQIPLIDQVESLHAAKSYAEWDDEDMIEVVNLLAHPKTEADRRTLIQAEKETLALECSTGSCVIRQQEFKAARALREGKAANAREALGLKIEQRTSVASTEANKHEAPNEIQAMILGIQKGDLQAVEAIRNKLTAETKMKHGDKKAARKSNREGLEALQQGDFNTAFNRFLTGSTLDPADVEILHNLSYAYLIGGKPTEARDSLVRTLRADPARAGAWANLGQSMAKLGELESAISCFQLALHFSRDASVTSKFILKLADSDPDAQVRIAAGKAQPAMTAISIANKNLQNKTASSVEDQKPTLPASAPNMQRADWDVFWKYVSAGDDYHAALAMIELCKAKVARTVSEQGYLSMNCPVVFKYGPNGVQFDHGNPSSGVIDFKGMAKPK